MPAPPLRLAALAALLVALAAPSAHAEPERVLLWHAYRGDERAAVEQIVGQLHARDPAVRVDLLAVPYEAFRARLTAAIPRGNGPDLFVGPHEAVGEWSRGGLLDPLPFPPALPPAAFLPSTVDALTWEGTLWAVPLSFKSLALFLNRALVREVPADLPALVAAGRAARYPLVYEAGNFYAHAALLHAFGGTVFGGDGAVDLDTDAAVRSFALAQGLVTSGAVPPEADGALLSNLFNSGAAAFAINGPWFLGEIRPEIDFAVAPLPRVAPEGEPLRPFLTVEALYLGARHTASDAAIATVVEALAGLDGSLLRARVGRQTVPLLAAAADRAVADDPILSAFVAQGALAVATPSFPAMGAVWEPANRGLRRLVRGAATPEEVARQIQREVGFTIRSTPVPAAPGPYLALLGALLLGGAALGLRSARRARVLDRLPAALPAYLYLLPAALGMTLVVFVPFLAGAAVSLFAHVDGTFTFVGLRNFARILTSADYGITDPLSFWFTLVVTVAWTVCNVALHVAIGLALALVLHDPWMKLKGVYRVLLIVPWAVPNYITALIWKGMFNRQFGAVNAFLGLFGVEPVSWFSNFFTSFAANVATNTWLGFPFMMVVTLGALQAIPRDLLEAAEVDGANAWQRFRHVTLPLLKPALLPAVILSCVWTFNMFNIIYLVSGGEPDGSTEILISEAYKWAFTRQAQYGYASAYALLIFGILWAWGQFTQRLAARAA